MLDQLFGSTTRVKLLRLFCRQPNDEHYIREIARKVHSSLNAVRRELINLEAMGFLISTVHVGSGEKKKYYRVNEQFVFLPELTSLIIKDQVLLKDNLTKVLGGLRGIKLLLLTGLFTQAVETQTDMVVIGKVSRRRLSKLLERFHRLFHQSLHYTIMTEEEYRYRLDITDRFLYNILEQRHITIVDKITSPNSRIFS